MLSIEKEFSKEKLNLIKKTMFKLNMEPKYLGYNPFIDIIIILYSNPNISLENIKKQISTKYNTTPSNIDRQIRTIISKAKNTILNNETENNLSSFFGKNEETFQIKSFSYLFIEYIKILEKQEIEQTENLQNQPLSDEEQIIKKRTELIKQTMFKLNMPSYSCCFNEFIDMVLLTYENPNEKMDFLKFKTGKKYNKSSKTIDKNLSFIINYTKKSILNNHIDPVLATYFTKTEKPYQTKNFLYNFIEYIKQLEQQTLIKNPTNSKTDIEKIIILINEELNYKSINNNNNFIDNIINNVKNIGITTTYHDIAILLAKHFNQTTYLTNIINQQQHLEKKDIKSIITEILNNLEINPTTKNFILLFDIIEYYYNTKEKTNIAKLRKIISEKHNITTTYLERNLRQIIISKIYSNITTNKIKNELTEFIGTNPKNYQFKNLLFIINNYIIEKENNKITNKKILIRKEIEKLNIPLYQKNTIYLLDILDYISKTTEIISPTLIIEIVARKYNIEIKKLTKIITEYLNNLQEFPNYLSTYSKTLNLNDFFNDFRKHIQEQEINSHKTKTHSRKKELKKVEIDSITLNPKLSIFLNEEKLNYLSFITKLEKNNLRKIINSIEEIDLNYNFINQIIEKSKQLGINVTENQMLTIINILTTNNQNYPQTRDSLITELMFNLNMPTSTKSAKIFKDVILLLCENPDYNIINALVSLEKKYNLNHDCLHKNITKLIEKTKNNISQNTDPNQILLEFLQTKTIFKTQIFIHTFKSYLIKLEKITQRKKSNNDLEINLTPESKNNIRKIIILNTFSKLKIKVSNISTDIFIDTINYLCSTTEILENPKICNLIATIYNTTPKDISKKLYTIGKIIKERIQIYNISNKNDINIEILLENSNTNELLHIFRDYVLKKEEEILLSIPTNNYINNNLINKIFKELNIDKNLIKILFNYINPELLEEVNDNLITQIIEKSNELKININKKEILTIIKIIINNKNRRNLIANILNAPNNYNTQIEYIILIDIIDYLCDTDEVIYIENIINIFSKKYNKPPVTIKHYITTYIDYIQQIIKNNKNNELDKIFGTNNNNFKPNTFLYILKEYIKTKEFENQESKQLPSPEDKIKQHRLKLITRTLTQLNITDINSLKTKCFIDIIMYIYEKEKIIELDELLNIMSKKYNYTTKKILYRTIAEFIQTIKLNVENTSNKTTDFFKVNKKNLTPKNFIYIFKLYIQKIEIEANKNLPQQNNSISKEYKDLILIKETLNQLNVPFTLDGYQLMCDTIYYILKTEEIIDLNTIYDFLAKKYNNNPENIRILLNTVIKIIKKEILNNNLSNEITNYIGTKPKNFKQKEFIYILKNYIKKLNYDLKEKSSDSNKKLPTHEDNLINIIKETLDKLNVPITLSGYYPMIDIICYIYNTEEIIDLNTIYSILANKYNKKADTIHTSIKKIINKIKKDISNNELSNEITVSLTTNPSNFKPKNFIYTLRNYIKKLNNDSREKSSQSNQNTPSIENSQKDLIKEILDKLYVPIALEGRQPICDAIYYLCQTNEFIELNTILNLLADKYNKNPAIIRLLLEQIVKTIKKNIQINNLSNEIAIYINSNPNNFKLKEFIYAIRNYITNNETTSLEKTLIPKTKKLTQ